MFLTILKLLITPIISPIVGTASAIITDHFRSRREFLLRKLELDNRLEIEKLKSTNNIKLEEVELEKKLIGYREEIQSLISKKTGIKFIDSFSSLVRPTTTFWFILFIYPFACWYYRENILILESVITIVEYIISFWFVGRELRKSSCIDK